MEPVAADPIYARLEKLAIDPPPVLLLEGGTGEERMTLALHWAMANNCPTALREAENGMARSPCGSCPTCRQIAALEYLDLHVFDGRLSNREDDEKAGPIRALRVENMRELKAAASTRPSGAGRRVGILLGLLQTREEALNSLLKTLEEPGEHTLFVLLTPQRQQILPTLVSRSFCLTLPWTDANADSPELREWESGIAGFLEKGQGFLDAVAAKGNMDSEKAAEILLLCQRSLARSLSGSERNNGLDRILKPLALSPQAAASASRWIMEANEMLTLAVNPARVLEAFSTKLYMLLRQNPRSNTRSHR